jgi:hypothetical protein
MKRVMCIDDAHWGGAYGAPEFGEITTVSWEGIGIRSGILSYEFVEYPPPPRHRFRYFSQKYFVESSNIDEVELVKKQLNGISNTPIEAI